MLLDLLFFACAIVGMVIGVLGLVLLINGFIIKSKSGKFLGLAMVVGSAISVTLLHWLLYGG